MERQINSMTEKKLELLEQKLKKKNELLDCLQGLFDQQTLLLDSPSLIVEEFDASMEALDQKIQELNRLNEEVSDLCGDLCLENLQADSSCVSQIECLRTLAAQIMDQADSLKKKEQSNRQKLEAYFENERRNLGMGRRSSKAALGYYKNMSRSHNVPPQFMDQKK